MNKYTHIYKNKEIVEIYNSDIKFCKNIKK